jgi:hypothetical protein
MSLIKKGVKTFERQYGDFTLNLNYIPYEGAFLVIKDKSDRISPTTLRCVMLDESEKVHLTEMPLSKMPDKSFEVLSEEDLYDKLIAKAAEKGYNISSIKDGESPFKGIYRTFNQLVEDFKKQHPIIFRRTL